MADKSAQWLKQAEYDFDTAEYMFKGGRYLYTVFMCHLSIEKALKGLFTKKTSLVPPKTHNLVYFLDKLKIAPPEIIGKFIIRLNEASVVTRYPEDLEQLSRDYNENIVRDIIKSSKEALEWIKKMY